MASGIYATQMSRTFHQHSTCLHVVNPDDPRRGPIRPICYPCWNLVRDQAVASIESRFWSLIAESDFETSQRYYTSLELAFALGRFEELELVLWAMTIQCVADHPRLLSIADIDELVTAAIRFFLVDTPFDYTDEDSRAFVQEVALPLAMRSTSLNARRRPSDASDSGSIQLPASHSIVDDNLINQAQLAAELGNMTIDEEDARLSRMP